MAVSIPEAAQLLSVSVDSVRRRIRSGALPANRDERGQWWLDLAEGEQSTPRLLGGDQMGLGVGTPLQRNERESLINTLEDQIDDLKARLDRSETERRDEAAKFRTERDRLLALIERLAVGAGQ